jgi:GMP synthase-like glutamine amidotransferase
MGARKEHRMTRDSRPVRVAIVDNSVFPDIYQPVGHWSRYLPAEWEAFTARHHQFPDLRGFSHMILTGSEASILEPESWVFEEAEVVREAVRSGLVVLGSCWGHQLLAFALAGPGHVARCAKPEIGWIAVRLAAESDLLGPVGEEPLTFSIHFDEVRDIGGIFEVLASSDACAVQAMRLKDAPVWGLQCHPEVDIPTGLKFLRDLVDRGFKGKKALIEALASLPVDSGLIRRIVPAFLALTPRTPVNSIFSLDKKLGSRS